MNKPASRPPELKDFQAAISHVNQSVESESMANSTAKGILYSVIETLGVLLGDPDLPSHLRSGYDGVLETAHELNAKLHQTKE